MSFYLACDIGGTDLKYSILDQSGSFIVKSAIPTKADLGGIAIIDQIVKIYFDLVKQYPISGIAISAAGTIDPNTTIVVDSTDTINNYANLNFRQELNKQIPNLKVSVDNDVNCMALCEVNLGNAKNSHLVVALTVGTGIGGAITIDGNLLRGNDFSVGEWGKMHLGNSTFEKLASISALVSRAKKLYPNLTDGKSVFKLYDAGDPKIGLLVKEFYTYLATGIANLVFAVNPSLIVIGGGITARGQKFLAELLPYLKKKLTPYLYERTKVVLAKHRNDAGMLGAFEHYKKTFLKSEKKR
ncbi:MAG: ROK family protein [Acholeplasmataceae bacterium]|jgi:predicted NBD/HSP70 family sugar kinase|nr:ROK family protein [Acholeplasmataceae bacterium]